MAHTDRLRLPLLAAGQAQKELTHNEALLLIDASVQLAVDSADLAAPPGTPAPGQVWIVADGATGAWLDHDNEIAAWTSNGWLFVVPSAGWRAWVINRGHIVRFDGAVWIDEAARADGYYVEGERVIAARQAAISSPVGGATQDAEARASIDSILAVLRAHGLIDA